MVAVALKRATAARMAACLVLLLGQQRRVVPLLGLGRDLRIAEPPVLGPPAMFARIVEQALDAHLGQPGGVDQVGVDQRHDGELEISRLEAVDGHLGDRLDVAVGEAPPDGARACAPFALLLLDIGLGDLAQGLLARLDLRLAPLRLGDLLARLQRVDAALDQRPQPVALVAGLLEADAVVAGGPAARPRPISRTLWVTGEVKRKTQLRRFPLSATSRRRPPPALCFPSPAVSACRVVSFCNAILVVVSSRSYSGSPIGSQFLPEIR